MDRVLEPEVMDTSEDAEEYDAMDFTEPNTKFAEDALALLGNMQNARIVDIGTGTARIPMLMLERRSDIRIVACDLADQMLAVARRNLERAGIGDRCELVKLDAKGSKLPPAHFDLVMCNSVAHHIPNPQTLFDEVARIVRPGGALLIRDLIRPESQDAAWAIVNRVAAGEHPKQRQLFFDSLCAAFTVDEVSSYVRTAKLERMRVERCSDRHWTAERGKN